MEAVKKVKLIIDEKEIATLDNVEIKEEDMSYQSEGWEEIEKAALKIRDVYSSFIHKIILK